MLFARSSANALGIGKILVREQTRVRLAYFLAPGQEPILQDVDPVTVKPLILDPQTRVYFLDPADQLWRTGRSLFGDEDGEYVVAFPNKVLRKLPCEHLFVRCDLPIDDPTPFLARRVTESPYLHQRRSQLAEAFAEQRGAAAGITGLLSAGIELEPHQIEVVRRVLQDPVQRYLLADEVGLGKTIEAGIIIRQFVLDDPAGHQVLVAVPTHLVAQWREELEQRFYLGTQLDQSIRLVPFAKIENALASRLPRMLVIDEAHQVAALIAAPTGSADQRCFQRVRAAAEKAERLLLLSATPSLHNEVSFQAMLHLLDPAVYPLGALDAFRDRRDSHQRVAELFHVFHATESGSFLAECLDDMTAMFPADERLRDLAEQLRPRLGYGEDADDHRRAELVQEIRVHVSEAYRLHRRLLRNRRTDPRIEPVLPGREGLVRWEYDDPAAAPVAELLEEWRVAAAGLAARQPAARGLLAACHQLLVDAAADPLALRALADLRRGVADADDVEGLALTQAERTVLTGAAALPNETELLQRVADLATATENLARADATADGIARLWQAKPDTRLVVFTTFPRTAEEIYEALRARWGPRVLRHGHSGWERFRTEAGGLVLVCDRRAEEGLNLQGRRSVLIHYDLPLSPNRLEQRLGRLDRYGVGRAIRSAALLPRGAVTSHVWCDLVESHFRVFERSIAALQYLVEQEWPGLLSDLLFEGVDALTAAQARLGGEHGLIEETLRQIQVLDELDAIETTAAQQDFADYLIESERLRAGSWRASFHEYVEGRLHFRECEEPDTDGKTVRFQFRRPPQGGKSTLIPVGRFIACFQHVIDRQRSQQHPKEPITHPMTFSRPRARLTGTPLARLGHRFIDALTEYLRADDSGRAFGLWRYRPARVPASPPADLVFRFDYLLEGRVEEALASLSTGSAVTRQAVRRLADRLLVPAFVTLWIDDQGQLLDDADRLAVFAEPYRQGKSRSDGADRNLNADNWQLIESAFPPTDWSDLVARVRAAADREVERHLHGSVRLAERVEQARLGAETRQSQWNSRVAFLPSRESAIERDRAAADERLWAALIAGIARPAIRLEALGAVFVSNQNPFREGGEDE